jgi:NAD(P)-dependent dehydrogenase (short-subunit alcohol dehydrogenase family)
MTRNLALDVAPIRVNCVAPGVVDTVIYTNVLTYYYTFVSLKKNPESKSQKNKLH